MHDKQPTYQLKRPVPTARRRERKRRGAWVVFWIAPWCSSALVAPGYHFQLLVGSANP